MTEKLMVIGNPVPKFRQDMEIIILGIFDAFLFGLLPTHLWSRGALCCLPESRPAALALCQPGPAVQQTAQLLPSSFSHLAAKS